MHFQFWETFLNYPKCPTIGEESISLGNVCFSIASENENKGKLLKEARGKITLPIEDQQSESHLISLQTPASRRGMELRKCLREKTHQLRILEPEKWSFKWKRNKDFFLVHKKTGGICCQ